MKDHVKRCHTWLAENDVIIYNRTFDYKGVPFSIEKIGTKFFTINQETKYKSKPFPTKTQAVWWACIIHK